MKKIFLFLFGFLISATWLAIPFFSSASVLPFFGGFDVAEIPCTCSPPITWHFFIPLYYSLLPAPTQLGAPVIPTFFGALAAPPTVAFSTYVVRPTSWVLGTYTPYVQTCWINAGPTCFPLPNLGLISPITGVSPLP